MAVLGIEPRFSPRKGDVLPLDYTATWTLWELHPPQKVCKTSSPLRNDMSARYNVYYSF